MKNYTDTDVEIQCLCSCEICGNWYWRSQYNNFVCDNCKDIQQKRQLEYLRKANLENYSINPSSIKRAGKVFQIIVDHKDTGISAQALRREVAKRNIVSHVQTYDYYVVLERTGHLIYSDHEGKLYPFKNLNTGESYE